MRLSPEPSPTKKLFLQLGEMNGVAIPLALPTTLKEQHELSINVFRLGRERLLKEMGISTIHHLIQPSYPYSNPDMTLAELLEVDKKTEILTYCRTHSSPLVIQLLERHFAHEIQKIIQHYTYTSDGYHPSSIIESEELNCLGATILGGVILEKIGIPYLQAYIKKHAITLLATADGKLHWQDIQDPRWNREIQKQDIIGSTRESIRILLQEGTSYEISFQITDKTYRKHCSSWSDSETSMDVSVFAPLPGQHVMALHGIGNDFWSAKQYDSATLAYTLGLKSASTYSPIQDSLSALRKQTKKTPKKQTWQTRLLDLGTKFVEWWGGPPPWRLKK